MLIALRAHSSGISRCCRIPFESVKANIRKWYEWNCFDIDLSLT